MTDIILYIYPGACSRVTLVALEEIGLNFEDRTVNLAAGIQNGGDYLAINRKGKVPLIVIDGKPLTENAAILAYLDQRYPAAKLLPRYDDPIETAGGLSDLLWCASTLHPEVRQINGPQKWTLGDPAGVRADGMNKFAKECRFIGARVAAQGWWYGQDWSIIDVYLCWAYSTAAKGGFPLEDYPDLLAHAQRVRARPSFRRALVREVAAVAREGLNIDPASL